MGECTQPSELMQRDMKAERYPFSRAGSIEQNMLHVLEKRRACASIWIRRDLAKLGVTISATQASGALQRLSKAGLVKHEGAWALASKKVA